MSKQIRQMSGEEVMKLPRLGLDDTFEFRCKACGKCCKHREDVILTAYDMFRIANFLGRTPAEIFERYCHVYEGGSSHLPIVRVVPVPPYNSCPFLRNKRCAIHEKKPVVCRVYPLARIFLSEGGGAEFIYSGASCKHDPQTVTVREWIGDAASAEAEEAGRLWVDILRDITLLIHPDKLEISEEKRRNMLTMIFLNLYINYETDKPFLIQMKSNFETIKLLLSPFAEMTENDLPR
jgi:Fe-S-cluster containining protein